MKRFTKLSLVALVLLALSLTLAPRKASAHPMGNFSINQYSALTIGQDRVEIRFVLDMAEIPTFQELGSIRPDHSTDLTADQRTAYINSKVADISRNLSLTLNGNPLVLNAEDSPHIPGRQRRIADHSTRDLLHCPAWWGGEWRPYIQRHQLPRSCGLERSNRHPGHRYDVPAIGRATDGRY